MKNIDLAQRVLQELANAGVKEFVLCPGARNSPFTVLLDENKHLISYHFFEERSAAFFALGRIASTRRPVAIITTSGTAVAEVLPAAIEATYSSLPLMIITADRPKKFRGTGAPQTIDQMGIFSYYIEVMLDLDEENNHVSLKRLSWKKPIHINVCFQEPLLDAEPKPIILPEKAEREKLPLPVPTNTLSDISIFLQNHNPLIILGYLPDKAQQTVLAFLEKYQCPIYAEGISGMRGHPRIKNTLICSGDRMVNKLLKDGHCNSIVRIGGVPTIRAWRDLETTFSHLPVLSVSYNHFSGLSRDTRHFSYMEILNEIDIESTLSISPQLLTEDKEKYAAITLLLKKYPQSEPGLIHDLSKHLRNSSVYLGNSLPIREWDLAAAYDSLPSRIVGNRGANGIDGQISSFLGWAKKDSENWCLVGDLTTLYDLSSLWIAEQLPNTKLRCVVINNGGAQIFRRMFNRKIFLNEHHLSFEPWAKLWNWSYEKWTEIPQTLNLADRQIIELIPNNEQTKLFWDEYEKIWTS